ncbi:Gfo/Idh/MocA family protein [Paucisalibacillus globulus]|uniref:Gfo/Idh/MocA family protein n=1 Tax=Paucisalibacillus globulus TaxID=351095 RepID=UPI000428F376|nr:Gfo/Idh/MocA family oxidoreductase [Paucisalibacillus globulus]
MKIGMMSFAHMHAYSYAECLMGLENVELVGIFDDDVSRGEKVAEKFQTTHYAEQQAFLELEMDAVIICSENVRHKEMVFNAARAGKHILCEKPIATTARDAQEMIDVCEESDVILQIAFPVRFSPAIQHVKQLIDDGEIGEIIAFRSTNRGQNPGDWFVDEKQSGGGAVLDHTVHMVDIMRWYLGEEVVKVDAIVDSYFHGVTIDDAGLLTLEFENGVIASHDSSWSRFTEYPTWGDACLEVIGTKRTIKVDSFGEYLRMFTSGRKSLSHVLYGSDMDLGLINDFVDCIEKGREPSITGHDGLKALEVALAAYEAGEGACHFPK